jgi:hypothetical protein
VAAEIAAAQGISRGRAAGQLRIGLALAERLPRLGTLFADGVVDFQVVSAVVHRTELMIDTNAIPRLDRWLHRNAPRWGNWSRNRIVETVDYWVQALEPVALREARSLDETRPPENFLYRPQPVARPPRTALFFPQLALPTAELASPQPSTPPAENRGLMMPTRKHTKTQERAYRMHSERGRNKARIAAEAAEEAKRITACNDPPPY